MSKLDSACDEASRPGRTPSRIVLIATAVFAAAVAVAPVETRAACSPVTGPGTPSNTTVTCSGAVLNQDNPNGYGTGQQDNDIVNVQAGASITGSSAGLDLGAGNTVNFAAGSSASGTAAGVVLGTGTHVVNNDNGGTISAVGNVSIANGISAIFGSTSTVNNTGVISGTTTNAGGSAFGINAGDVNVTNSGTISATIPNGAFESVGIQGNNVTVANNGGTISASGTSQVVTIGILSFGNLTVTANSGTISGVDAAIVNSAGTLNVTNNVGGTIQASSGAIQAFGQTTISNAGTISGSFAVSVDSSVSAPTTIFNSGRITGTGGTAITFSATSTGNTLTLAPGFAITGTVGGGTGNILQLGGTGAGTFNAGAIGPQYQNFTTFNKIGASTFDLIGVGAQPWSVQGGVLLVDGTAGVVTVQSGATVGGNGTVGGLVVGGGGTAAPGGTLAGPSIGTLNVSGNVSFAASSTFQVQANAAGQASRIAATGTTTLSGGTVQVLAANGAFAPMTKYTILTSGVGVTGTFANVTSNLAFLTPTLSYDAHDVFLTLARNNFSFASEALTANQAGVASALDRAAQNAPLIQALLLQTDAGIRQAFDTLSGEVFASTQSLMIEDALLARQAILSRLLQMPYAGAQGAMAALGSGGPMLAYAEPQGGAFASAVPVKASPAPPADLVYWAQGVGAWGRIQGDGNAAEAKRDLAGVFTGLDRRFGDWRVGIAAGYTASNVDVSTRASSASVNTGHLGAYAGGSFGPWHLRGGADLALSAIDTNRSIVFPGFAETANAHFNVAQAQLFGEIGYGVALGSVAAEPFAGVAWVHLRSDAFAETGGLAALNGTAATQEVGYATLGAHLATSRMLGNGMTLTPRVSAAWQHAFGDVNPVAALTFQTLGTSFTTAGAPIARDAAVVDAGVDLRVTPRATFGLSYLGQLAASAQDHSVRGSFTWRF